MKTRYRPSSTIYVRRGNEYQTIGVKNHQVEILCDLMTDKLLSEIVMERTHLDNVLDLVFVNDEHSVSDVEVLVNSKLSDHNV